MDITISLVGAYEQDRRKLLYTILGRKVGLPSECESAVIETGDIKEGKEITFGSEMLMRTPDCLVPLPKNLNYRIKYADSVDTGDIVICVIEECFDDSEARLVKLLMQSLKTNALVKVVFCVTTHEPDTLPAQNDFRKTSEKIREMCREIEPEFEIEIIFYSVLDSRCYNHFKRHKTVRGLSKWIICGLAFDAFGRKKSRIDYDNKDALDTMIAAIDSELAREDIDAELAKSGWFKLVDLMKLDTATLKEIVRTKLETKINHLCYGSHSTFDMIELEKIRSLYSRIFETKLDVVPHLVHIIGNDPDFPEKISDMKTGTISGFGNTMLRVFETYKPGYLKIYLEHKFELWNFEWVKNLSPEIAFKLYSEIESKFGIKIDLAPACPDFKAHIFDTDTKAYVIRQDSKGNPAWQFYEQLIKLGLTNIAESLIQTELKYRYAQLAKMLIKPKSFIFEGKLELAAAPVIYYNLAQAIWNHWSDNLADTNPAVYALETYKLNYVTLDSEVMDNLELFKKFSHRNCTYLYLEWLL